MPKLHWRLSVLLRAEVVQCQSFPIFGTPFRYHRNFIRRCYCVIPNTTCLLQLGNYLSSFNFSAHSGLPIASLDSCRKIKDSDIYFASIHIPVLLPKQAFHPTNEWEAAVATQVWSSTRRSLELEWLTKSIRLLGYISSITYHRISFWDFNGIIESSSDHRAAQWLTSALKNKNFLQSTDSPWKRGR